MAATASQDNTLRLWDARDGKPIRVVRLQQAAVALAFNPDGTALLTGDNEGGVSLWDVSGGPGRPIDRHKDYINALGFSPDGKQFLAASSESGLRTYGLDGRRVLDVKDVANLGAAFSPDGTAVYAAGFDGVKVVDCAGTGRNGRR